MGKAKNKSKYGSPYGKRGASNNASERLEHVHVAAPVAKLLSELKQDDLSTQLFVAMFLSDVTSVQVVLAKGADPNVRKKDGHTHTAPLHMAVRMNDFKIAGALLTAGADPNSRDANGWTPLHRAASEMRDQLGGLSLGIGDYIQFLSNKDQIVELLLAAGADPNARNDQGDTPLHIAAEAGYFKCVQTLFAAGADPAAKDAKGHLPEEVAFGAAKEFFAVRRLALSEECDLLSCSAPARGPSRSTAL